MRKEEAQVLTEVYGGMHELAAAIHALIEKSAHEAPEVRVRHAVDLSHLEGEEVTVGAPAEPASEAPHDAKKRQKVIHVKEVKMRPKTEEHDFQFKGRHIRRFLGEGNKVKVTVMFRGREMAHRHLGLRLMTRMIEELEDVAQVEQQPIQEGRNMSMILISTSTKTHSQQ